MKIAIVPWSKSVLNNRMFQVSESGTDGEDVYNRVWKVMKSWFEEHGHQLETIDEYSDWNEVDYIVIHNGMHEEWTRKLLRKNLENKLIYRASEPEVVNSMHSKKNIRKLLKYYKYIITWNSELIDNSRIFLMNTVPYIMTERFGDIPFNEKKLLTAIYGNKSSTNIRELYTERRKIFDYFEQYENHFDLYGYGWNKDEYHNYKGTVNDKAEIYHKYKFAIAFENIKDTIGGVTEKIYDCICAGVVPIYYGSKNITDYVPANVFIDYREFKTVKELHEYLQNMDEKTYMGYLDGAKAYLHSELSKKAGVDDYCEKLERLMIENPAHDIRCTFYTKCNYSVITIGKRVKKILEILILRIKKHVK